MVIGMAIMTTSAKTRFQLDWYFPKNIKTVIGKVVLLELLRKYMGIVKSFHILIAWITAIVVVTGLSKGKIIVKNSLSRLFRRHTNFSFNEYVTNLRIDEAKRLMKEQPGMLLKDIAEIVGYQDQHYFSRIFKSITGITPSEFNT